MGMSGKFLVKLSAAPNPDYPEGTHQGSMWVRATWAKVSSLEEASKVCREFIMVHGIGGGNWTGGEVREKGKPVALVSYNGRVWEFTGWSVAEMNKAQCLYCPWGEES